MGGYFSFNHVTLQQLRRIQKQSANFSDMLSLYCSRSLPLSVFLFSLSLSFHINYDFSSNQPQKCFNLYALSFFHISTILFHIVLNIITTYSRTEIRRNISKVSKTTKRYTLIPIVVTFAGYADLFYNDNRSRRE